MRAIWEVQYSDGSKAKLQCITSRDDQYASQEVIDMDEDIVEAEFVEEVE